MGITFLLLLAILVLLAYPSFAFSINCCQKLNASKSSSLQKLTAGNASVYPLSCSYTNVKLIALHCHNFFARAIHNFLQERHYFQATVRK